MPHGGMGGPRALCGTCLVCCTAVCCMAVLYLSNCRYVALPQVTSERRHEPQATAGHDSDATREMPGHDVARTTAGYDAWRSDVKHHLDRAATRSWYTDSLYAGRPARPFLFDYVDKDGKEATVQWCSIPKNSCTLWQMFFARLGGCDEWPLERVQRNRPCSHGDSPWYYQIGDPGPVPPRGSTSGTDVSQEADLAELQLFGPGPPSSSPPFSSSSSSVPVEVGAQTPRRKESTERRTRIALVRNPLLRTLSAYLDKGCVSLPSESVPHSAQPYLAMNFTSFGDFVTREFGDAALEPFTARDCGRGGRLWGVNQHWRPQLCSCGFVLGAPYDIVAHVEDPDAALSALEDTARLPPQVVHDGWGDDGHASFYEEMTLPHPRGVEEHMATHLTHANDKSMLFFTPRLVDLLSRALSHEIHLLGYTSHVQRLRESVAACTEKHCGTLAWTRMGKSAINAVCEPIHS